MGTRVWREYGHRHYCYSARQSVGNTTIQGSNVLGLPLCSANIDVVATSSPSSFESLRSLGAACVFDYNKPSCGADIRAAVPGLKYALDCASKGDSAAICAAALADGPGIYRSLLPIENFPRTEVDSKLVTSFEIFGKRFFFGPQEYQVREGAFEFAKELIAIATKLAVEGKLRPHKQVVREGGLPTVLEGLDDLRSGKIRGAKIVVKA